MLVVGSRKQTIISKFKTHGKDTGSPEVQIALISQRINDLAQHFEVHKTDHSSRRGLLKLVGQRRKLLGYLRQADQNRYSKLIRELGIRK